jgi:hypothetical protein
VSKHLAIYLAIDELIEARKEAGMSLEDLSRLSYEISQYDTSVSYFLPDEFDKLEQDEFRGISPIAKTYARMFGKDIVLNDIGAVLSPIDIKDIDYSKVKVPDRRLDFDGVEERDMVPVRIDVVYKRPGKSGKTAYAYVPINITRGTKADSIIAKLKMMYEEYLERRKPSAKAIELWKKNSKLRWRKHNALKSKEK